MARYSLVPGTVLHTEDGEPGMVVAPEWDDATVRERWAHYVGEQDEWSLPEEIVRKVLHRYSARQLRDDPPFCDDYWAEDGELASNVTVVWGNW